MKTETLTVNLTGKETDEVPLDSFAKVVSAMRGLLNELDKDHSLKWRVKHASLNSPLTVTIAADVQDRAGSEVVDIYVSLFRTSDASQLNPGKVSKTALNHVKTICNVVSNDGVSRVEFESPGRSKVTVWPKNQRPKQQPATQQPVPANEYSSRVELTGTLEIATTEHNQTNFFVRDRMNQRKIRCEVDREVFNQALEAMKKATPPRVAVFGKVLYRDDLPLKMKVETFTVLPTLDEHPGLYAVQGIDITGGMDSVEYVRSLRNGD